MNEVQRVGAPAAVNDIERVDRGASAENTFDRIIGSRTGDRVYIGSKWKLLG